MKRIIYPILFLVTLLLMAACATKSPMAQAEADFNNGNYVRAFEKLHFFAERRNPKAQYALGYMYYYGLGTAKDQDIARSWIRKSAKSGYAPSIQALQLISQDATQFGPFQAGLKSDAIVPADNLFSPPLTQTKKTIPAEDTTQAEKTTPAEKPLRPQLNKTSWLQSQDPTHYTLQMSTHEKKAIIDKIIQENLQLSGSVEYSYFEHDRVWRGMVAGNFSSKQDARRALVQLPKSLRDTTKIVSIKDIQERLIP